MNLRGASEVLFERRVVRTLRWAVLPALFIGGCSSSPPVATAAVSTAAVTAGATVIEAATPEPAPRLTPEPVESASDAAAEDPGLWPTATAAPTTTAVPTTTPIASPPDNPFTGAIQSLGPAPIGDAAFGTLPTPDRVPVGIRIDDLGLASAPVTEVGVNPDQTFEVPGADEVGWYRFGPTPGGDGSAVLAAHIAFNGVDGVFRNLADLSPGATVEVVYNDGSTAAFQVRTITDYDKQGLPASLWAKDGPPQLALITCGGTFNRQLNSYESNTVAIATPIP